LRMHALTSTWSTLFVKRMPRRSNSRHTCRTLTFANNSNNFRSSFRSDRSTSSDYYYPVKLRSTSVHVRDRRVRSLAKRDQAKRNGESGERRAESVDRARRVRIIPSWFSNHSPCGHRVSGIAASRLFTRPFLRGVGTASARRSHQE